MEHAGAQVFCNQEGKPEVIQLLGAADFVFLGSVTTAVSHRGVIDIHYGLRVIWLALLALEMKQMGVNPKVYVDRHDGIVDIAVHFEFNTNNATLLETIFGQQVTPHAEWINTHGITISFTGEADMPDTGDNPFFGAVEQNPKFEIWLRYDERSEPLVEFELDEFETKLPYREQAATGH